MNAKEPAHEIRVPDGGEAARAFARVEPEILALRPDEVRRVTVEVPQAVSIALGALPRLEALRPRIARELPHHPLESLDRLRDYALAMLHAHLLTVPRPQVESARRALVDEARVRRGELLLAAEALAVKGLVPGDLVAKIRSGAGHLDLAGDLIALSAAFAERWALLHDKTAVERHEVERAGELGADLLLALTQGESRAKDSFEPVELRARAFTLLLRHYEECRHAVTYLRRHESDADRIAPSLFTRAARMKRASAA